jgi:hypothetical protein
VQKLKQKLPQLAGLAAESEREEDEGISLAAQAKTHPPAKTTKKTTKR